MKKRRIAIGSLVFICVAFALVGALLRFTDLGFPSSIGFATRADFVAYERSHHFDLWQGTFYCGDDADGISWFVHREMPGSVQLSMPATAWEPPRRMPYTHWSSGWQKLRSADY